ncbi:MAG: pyridoxal phosphate-dependent aminotransferase family protein, partial [Desulfobacula sp.]|nr:pyridoxal phosphate-dependent aminotransferase family protein [Desulfobacula sp.]
MSTEKLDYSLEQELKNLQEQGRAKSSERIIEQYIPGKGKSGPRYKLVGSDNEFIRLNSNSYLSLSNHPQLMLAADEATNKFGV